MLPNFFLVGAPKAGTTSLYHYLAQHPQVYMSPIKEPCYFSDEIRPENLAPEIRGDSRDVDEYLAGPMTERKFGGPVVRWEDYLRLYAAVRDEVAIGEASVIYLWSPSAARNIARVVPDARILIVLRDPIERAWSQYRDMVTQVGPRWSFDELVAASLSYRGDQLTFEHPFLELGRYREQVARYTSSFAAVQIAHYEHFRGAPQSTLASIFRFLEVDDSFLPDMTRRHRERTVDPPPMSEATRALLEEYYADEIAYLAELLSPPASAAAR
jgi:hypothetical protein